MGKNALVLLMPTYMPALYHKFLWSRQCPHHWPNWPCRSWRSSRPIDLKEHRQGSHHQIFHNLGNPQTSISIETPIQPPKCANQMLKKCETYQLCFISFLSRFTFLTLKMLWKSKKKRNTQLYHSFNTIKSGMIKYTAPQSHLMSFQQ